VTVLPPRSNDPRPEVVDAHHHLWSLEENRYGWLQTPPAGRAMLGDYAAIRRTYNVEEYRSDIVEAVADDPISETRWLDDQANVSGLPTAIVAGGRLESPEIRAILEAQLSSHRVKGVRQALNWHSETHLRSASRPDLLDDPAWRRGFAVLEELGLSFDLQVFPHQFADSARLAHDFPNVVIALNHGGMLATGDMDDRATRQTGLRLLAKEENVTVKVSGFGINNPAHTATDLERWFDELVELFGPSRCMLGSDYPVDKLHSDGNPLLQLCELAGRLSPSEDHAIRIGTAARTYRLAIDGSAVAA
jgi:predicted TIM-barrel fold metal-dependent hydrolase